MIDTWTQQARDLYERRQAPEIRRIVDAFPPLNNDQRHALAVLLAPQHEGEHPRHAERAATAC